MTHIASLFERQGSHIGGSLAPSTIGSLLLNIAGLLLNIPGQCIWIAAEYSIFAPQGFKQNSMQNEPSPPISAFHGSFSTVGL